MDSAHIMLLVLGVVIGAYAIRSALVGKVYCRGWYSRSEPAGFWGSVVVYFGWSVMMLYFAFKG
jgi:hypothetical protein